jgi:PKD repeat protein
MDANFTFTPSTGEQPLTVNFIDASTSGVDEWSWDFGDGNTSSSQNPSNTFLENGSYSVQLNVTKLSPPDSDSITKTVNVKPLAEFIANPINGAFPLEVSFTDNSVTNITSWLWDFGDGTSSIEQNPTKVYTNPGVYTVSLTVTGPGGSDSIIKTAYITVDFPEDAYYVDLNKEESGIGTTQDPLNYQDFSNKTDLGDNSFNYKIRGNIELDSTKHNNFIGKININMLPWDLEEYGPWRIHVPSEGFTGYSISAKKMSGAIIQTDLNDNYSDTLALKLLLCGSVIENSHIKSNNRMILSISDNSYLCGVNLLGSTVGNTILGFDDTFNSSPAILGVENSIVDVRDLGVRGSRTKLSGSSFYTNNTVFNYGGVDRIGDLQGITGIHHYPQFDYDIPEPWPEWDAGAQGSTGMDDPNEWASWSTWGKMVRVGSGSYTNIPTGLYGNTRLGVGALYFDSSPTFSINKTKTDFINVLSNPIKTSNKYIAMGWIRNPATNDGGTLYPLVIADSYGRILEDGAASFKLGIKREGEDYRIIFSGSQSKLIKRSLNIDIRDNDWHFIVYACINDDGLMKYYVDGIVLPSDTTLDSEGFSKDIARSEHVRLGGGDVYSPYLYRAGTAIALYNWRVGFNFCIHQEWIQDLMKIDKTNLGIL